MKNNLQVIGTTQYIQLPEHSKDSNDLIPAKIDTGADSSAIWASSISERDGVLSYALFAPNSTYYTGEVLSTNQYKVSKVKNSFGVSESRYKVGLKLKINNKKYNVTFNLADRSNSRFPILIGKSFLKDRFVVDVSLRDAIGSSSSNPSDKPIIVLKSTLGQRTRDFFDLVTPNLKSELILNTYTDLKFEINEKSEPKISLTDGRDISCAKIVYFKSHNLFPEHAGAIAKYLQYKHVPFIDQEVANIVSSSKLSELFILAANGVSVPQTKVFTGREHIPSYEQLRGSLGDVFVIKDASSDRGKNNFLVRDEGMFNEAMERLQDVQTLIFQRFIENEGFLRVLLMAGEIVQIVKRLPSEHKDPLRSHLNKPHGSANASEIDPDEISSDVIALARQASLALRRSICGVDLIQDKTTKKWYVLEANNNPETAKGINVTKKAEGLARALELKER